ncbi:Crp/Fnr family transcriptional regulator [Pedobacter sp. HDW13]|uniref:Crp/Fnr family transcriptional regulator n=1 Tax=unclassified Pedobacter TaxID=2628915 RepID=UPI000F59C631|nr:MULTISPECIES: Crp/Fnr family transcriptional regulator [unclassified Pedobacter]QIL41459.1 Crp/Fnr family transcriptional regulator [Pedobacter sp. HDW13]RQO77963.1 Crp/Fnr family transcriptional regulator [Pedobacter sp. KBW01]
MNPEKKYTLNKWGIFNGFSPLITVFRSYHDLTPEIEYFINQHTFPVIFKKNKFISSPLHRNEYAYLIVKGVVRGYLKDDKKEFTTWIAKEGELIGSSYSFGNWNKSIEEYIQALEEVEAVAIPYDIYVQLYDIDHITNYIGRKIIQLHYFQSCERALISRLQTAEKKYIRFMQSYPGLVSRVGLKYIASFLGIRIETLSRIRSRLIISTTVTT